MIADPELLALGYLLAFQHGLSKTPQPHAIKKNDDAYVLSIEKQT